MRAKDTVYGGNFGNGRITLGDAVQGGLNQNHTGAGGSPAQWGSGIGAGDAHHRCIGDDFNISVIASQDLGRIITLPCQILAAPLAETLAGDGGSVTKLGSQRLHKSRPPEIIVEQFLGKTGHIFKITPALDKKLVIGRGAGDVKIIATAAVKLRVYPVEGKGNNGQNVGPESAFLPSGINFAGSYVFYIIYKADCDVFRIRIGRPKMDGDPLGNVG